MTVTSHGVDWLGERPARSEVESLVAEADERARQVVCEELADQLAERYRAAVVAELGATGRATTAEPVSDRPIGETGSKGSADDAPDTAWYLYAIVRAADIGDVGDTADLNGVEGCPIALVRAGDLTAVTSEVPLVGFRSCDVEPDLSPDGWLQQAVRAHEHVVERLCSQVTALPLRFGALYPSHAHIREVLDTRAEQMRAELDRLDGAAEWGVKVRVPEPTPCNEQPPPAADATDGTEWMLRRRETAAAREESRRQRAGLADDIEHALSVHAREVVVRASSRPGDTGMLTLDAVYLVSHSAEAGFEDTLREVGERCAREGVELDVTGPWPPYHFVQLLADVPTRMGATAATQARAEAGEARIPEPRIRHGAAS